MSVKTFYIAGPMAGYEDFNFPAFFETEAQLKSLGFNVINPARLDEEQGFIEGTDTENNIVPPDAHAQYMRRDLRAILSADALLLLAGWELSKGANTELFIARSFGMPVFVMSFAGFPKLSTQRPVWYTLDTMIADRVNLATQTVTKEWTNEKVRVL